MTRIKNELTKGLNALVTALEEAAGTACYQRDQGVGKEVDEAERALIDARAALVKRLETMQRSLQRYKMGKTLLPRKPKS